MAELPKKPGALDTTLTEEWDIFYEAVITMPISDIMKGDLRKAFFAGMYTGFMKLMTLSAQKEITDVERNRVFSNLVDECRDQVRCRKPGDEVPARENMQ